MKLLDLLGFTMRPLRSDASKLIESTPSVSGQPQTIIVTSPVFDHGAAIPKSHTVDGEGLLPALTWSNIPSGCQSLILVVEDPDAPKAVPFVHGIVYNIPADWRALSSQAISAGGLSPDSVANGLEVGTNSMSKAAYMAPAPPPGHGVHHYHFQLIALDGMLLFADAPSLADVKEAIVDRVLASGELVGLYER